MIFLYELRNVGISHWLNSRFLSYIYKYELQYILISPRKRFGKARLVQSSFDSKLGSARFVQTRQKILKSLNTISTCAENSSEWRESIQNCWNNTFLFQNPRFRNIQGQFLGFSFVKFMETRNSARLVKYWARTRLNSYEPSRAELLRVQLGLVPTSNSNSDMH